MILYRSSPKKQGETDYSESYTVKIPLLDNRVMQTSCDSMFANTTINNEIIIGNNVIDLYLLLQNCTNFGNSVYIKGTVPRRLFVRSMFESCNNSKRKNIFFNSVFNSNFGLSDSMSVIGRSITWTRMTDGNGFYNTTYNIYCYNNYSGV